MSLEEADTAAFNKDVLARLERYGALNHFNALITLIAIIKSDPDDTLNPALCDMDKAADCLRANPWIEGIVETAFHLKAFKIVRDLPMLRAPPLECLDVDARMPLCDSTVNGTTVIIPSVPTKLAPSLTTVTPRAAEPTAAASSPAVAFHGQGPADNSQHDGRVPSNDRDNDDYDYHFDSD